MGKKVKEVKTELTEGEEVQTESTEKETGFVKEILGTILYFAGILLFVWFVITFVGQRTEVSGSSMYDTLENKDSLWVDKLSYHFKEPERFDIVVFPHKEIRTNKNGEDEEFEVYFIKRVIGLPGETICIDKDGIINVNGKPIEGDIYGYEEIIPNDIWEEKEFILGEDEYFVMGDNRNDSLDSRYDEVGSIEKDEIKGKAIFRIWPLKKFGKIE